MVQQIPATEIIYPDSDGKPMADHPEQFQWIVTLKENLELMYADDPDVFVAGDLLWYPIEGNNRLCQAPDALVAFTRPKGYRGSYKQWEENNIPPQVVFEILSPSNRRGEMARKLQFYNWVSPHLGIRFVITPETWEIYRPDGSRFLTYVELGQKLEQTSQQLEQTSQQLEIAQARVDRLAAQLGELGVDPEAI